MQVSMLIFRRASIDINLNIELLFQDLQYVFLCYLLINCGAYFQNRPGGAITETMVPFQDHITFQLVIFQVLLDQLKGFPVPAAETGTSHTYLNLFSYQDHVGVLKSKLII